MPEIRLLLGEEDFRRLVSGRIVESEAGVRGTRVWIQLALQDIGFDRMTVALRDAIEGSATDDGRPADHIFTDIIEPGARPADQDNESPTEGESVPPAEEGEQS